MSECKFQYQFCNFVAMTRAQLTMNPFFACVLKVYELTLHYTQHWDHNVVTAALELLQQIFRTPPPQLLHMLITAGSIAHATVFRQDAESRARSGSILEFIGKLINQSLNVWVLVETVLIKLFIPFHYVIMCPAVVLYL